MRASKMPLLRLQVYAMQYSKGCRCRPTAYQIIGTGLIFRKPRRKTISSPVAEYEHELLCVETAGRAAD